MAEDKEPPVYRVRQLSWNSRSGFANVDVHELEDLVTHHPHGNRNARLIDGVVVGGERGRQHALIGGEIQEIAIVPGFPERVLIKKDFLLEDSQLPAGPGARAVDVPSPLAGYIGAVNPASGRVDIYDRQGGELIARLRHLSPVYVQVGDTVAYGQALGVQSDRRTQAKHVHLEVDTRYYRQFANYMADLAEGRLRIDPALRAGGIEPRPLVDDGVVRLGESSERIRDLQSRLRELGYRDAQGREIERNGHYGVAMQAAVIRFQQTNGLEPTGDIDEATLRLALPPQRREADRTDHISPGVRPQANHPLLDQARERIQALDQSLGRRYDEASERLAGAVAVLARENGLTRIDHVLLSLQTPTAGAGEHVFAVQGDPASPVALRVHMRTDAAIATPVEQSLRRLAELEGQPRYASGHVDADLAQAQRPEPLRMQR